MDHPKMKVIVERDHLYRELRHLRDVMKEYEGFLEAFPRQSEWEREALALLRGHQARLEHARATLSTVDLVAAFLRELVQHSSLGEFVFHPEPTSSTADTEFRDGHYHRLATLVAQLHGVAEHAPLALQERLRLLLGTSEWLLTAIDNHDTAKIENGLHQIYLLTSNRESRELLREIAMIAKDIYGSLSSFSENLPLEELSIPTEGISDAVDNLRSVVDRLEEAAMSNLDALEASVSRAKDTERQIGETLEGLRRTQQKLGALKLVHPEILSAINALQDNLSDRIGSPLMLIHARAESNRDNYISMMTNQSFQDLTGQTMKKIIASIEQLQVQLVTLLECYRPVLGSQKSVANPKELLSTQDNAKRQSQDQVDSLLADLGF